MFSSLEKRAEKKNHKYSFYFSLFAQELKYQNSQAAILGILTPLSLSLSLAHTKCKFVALF
jgi:hypothetical protein